MKAVGCELCRHRGFKGRMGIFEIFQIDDQVRYMINDGVSTLQLRQRARELGCDIACSSTLPGTASRRNMERHGFSVTYPKLVLLKDG